MFMFEYRNVTPHQLNYTTNSLKVIFHLVYILFYFSLYQGLEPDLIKHVVDS